ncbi:ISAs1 family transposase, partial [Snuella lapsa]|uniref:ISAs1 family transposase n=1 Tax=Snuella lapsa TaxID=870481 RepID=UPI0031EB14E6
EGVIAIDGKTICGAKDKSKKSSIAPHILSAMASESGICLGQVKTQEKSNEITAIPELIKSLEIKDCTITIDAMGCQREIVSSIIDENANYVIAAKANQGNLLEAIKDTVKLEKPQSVHLEEDFGHGRVEKRTAKVFNNLSHLNNSNQWRELNCFIQVEKETYSKSDGKTTNETRYYISNLNLNAKQANHIIRSHWAIENKLHWSLDVIFGEDHSRKRTENTPENMNIIMKIVLTLVNQEQTFKKSKNR